MNKPMITTFNLLALTGNKASNSQQAKPLLKALESTLSALGYTAKAGVVRCAPETLQQALTTAELMVAQGGQSNAS
jgi:hypothetical protein